MLPLPHVLGSAGEAAKGLPYAFTVDELQCSTPETSYVAYLLPRSAFYGSYASPPGRIEANDCQRQVAWREVASIQMGEKMALC